MTRLLNAYLVSLLPFGLYVGSMSVHANELDPTVFNEVKDYCSDRFPEQTFPKSIVEESAPSALRTGLVSLETTILGLSLGLRFDEAASRIYAELGDAWYNCDSTGYYAWHDSRQEVVSFSFPLTLNASRDYFEKNAFGVTGRRSEELQATFTSPLTGMKTWQVQRRVSMGFVYPPKDETLTLIRKKFGEAPTFETYTSGSTNVVVMLYGWKGGAIVSVRPEDQRCVLHGKVSLPTTRACGDLDGSLSVTVSSTRDDVESINYVMTDYKMASRDSSVIKEYISTHGTPSTTMAPPKL